jgi:putative spermidine/putrescine transport system permease protein
MADAVSAGAGLAPATSPQRTAIPWGSLFGLAPILLVLTVFFVGPLIVNFLESLKSPSGAGGLQQYGRIFGDAYYLMVIGQTLLFGVAVTTICAFLGYPIGYAVARSHGLVKAVLILVVVAPLLVNVVVRSFGWMVILGGAGAINAGLRALGLPKAELMYNWTGVTIAMVHVLLPFMILSVASAIESLDERLEEAARVLGASSAGVFRYVTLPLSIEGVVTGAILVFTLTIGSFVTVLLLGKTSTMVLPLLMYQQLTVSSDWPFAAAMGATLLGLVSALLWLQATLRSAAARRAE